MHTHGIPNAAFLRSGIENLASFFAPGEVSEIWITFPDPQMQHARRRLTAARFLNMYRQVLAPGGVVHLKTDSPFLYTFTSRLAAHNALEVLADTADLYGAEHPGIPEYVGNIQTFYEQQWLSRGKQIKYLSFRLPDGGTPLADPEEDDIQRDDYHSYARGMNPDWAARAHHKRLIPIVFMALYPSLITDILRTVRYPGNGQNLVEAGMVEDDIRIDGKKVSFLLFLTSLPTRS